MHLEIRKDGADRAIVDPHGMSTQEAAEFLQQIMGRQRRLVFQVPYEEVVAAPRSAPTTPAPVVAAQQIAMPNGRAKGERAVVVHMAEKMVQTASAGLIVDEFSQADINGWTPERGPRGITLDDVADAIGADADCRYKAQEVMVRLYNGPVPYNLSDRLDSKGKQMRNPVYQWFYIRMQRVERNIVRHNPGYKFAPDAKHEGYRSLQPDR